LPVRFLFSLPLIAALWLAACAPAPASIPASPSPSPSPRPQIVFQATRTPRPVATAPPTATSTPRPSPTPWPLILLQTPGEAPPPATLDPALLTRVAAGAWSGVEGEISLEGAPGAGSQRRVLVGYSVEGREILAREFGDGERTIVLTGGLHGGWEANTVALVDALIGHFEKHPEDVLPGIRLALIPVANPDGLLHGRTPEGRFNANGVDLNRNWGCGWLPEAVWRDQPVNPGPAPLSEPETSALAAYILRLRPAVALFYHSAANGVFAGHCDGDHGSAAVAAVYGAAAGYAFGSAFSAYPVSGTAASWADGQGIAAADVELKTWTNAELDQNLRALMALQRWLTGLEP